MIVRRHRSAALLAAVALTLTLSCKFEPFTPELHYSLNGPVVEKNPDLQGDPGAQAQLAGVLEMLVGTPKDPRFLALKDWDFDPNYWGEDLVKKDENALAALIASNRAAYREQIASIEAGDFENVFQPRFADDLWRWWLALKAEKAGDAAALKEEGVKLFSEYYPSLSNSAAFYRNQCFHCHGTEGGGNGSTSRFLNPRPRDYRPGKFKFTALKGKSRPRHEDVYRVLTEGVYTTAMPSFRRFTDAQLHGLVDYVRLLAIRGETEILLASFYTSDEGLSLESVQENYGDVVAKWRGASKQVIAAEDIPAVTPERLAHGRTLFMTPGEKGGANCVSCHGTSGRGDGASAFEVDPLTKETRRVKDEWGNEISVRDLTRGVFRFGRRPIDLYRRIYAGINGTPMPEHIGMTVTEDGKQHPMTESDIWDLAFFVRTLSVHEATVAAAPSHH
ncbi:MAG: c-type cytochrome [Planctomycetes bacterium]|nr:c-type cytochrome [Planctomycetota bacterium]